MTSNPNAKTGMSAALNQELYLTTSANFNEALKSAHQEGYSAAIEDAAKVAEDLNWVLPIDSEQLSNEHAEDVATEICVQTAAAIRALKNKETS